MSQPDLDAMAGEVVSLIKSAITPLQERIAQLEQRPVVVPPAEIAPDDIAASVAGLLRKELADLETPAQKTQKRIVRDGSGAVKYEIEETT